MSNAQPLLNIVPDDVPLAVEAFVSNVDSGAVEKGQFAAVKVDAFPFTRYGLSTPELLTSRQMQASEL